GASPSATRAITSPVAGLMVSNVRPLVESSHLPSTSILVWRTWTGGLPRRSAGSVACGVVAVVMWPPWVRVGKGQRPGGTGAGNVVRRPCPRADDTNAIAPPRANHGARAWRAAEY